METVTELDRLNNIKIYDNKHNKNSFYTFSRHKKYNLIKALLILHSDYYDNIHTSKVRYYLDIYNCSDKASSILLNNVYYYCTVNRLLLYIRYLDCEGFEVNKNIGIHINNLKVERVRRILDIYYMYDIIKPVEKLYELYCNTLDIKYINNVYVYCTNRELYYFIALLNGKIKF